VSSRVHTNPPAARVMPVWLGKYTGMGVYPVVNGLNRSIAGALSKMARDHWVENLRCPRCRKTGEALLSTVDAYSWNVQVETIPKGFEVIESENSINFHCSTCATPVEP
jgi:hypothetical protein